VLHDFFINACILTTFITIAHHISNNIDVSKNPAFISKIITGLGSGFLGIILMLYSRYIYKINDIKSNLNLTFESLWTNSGIPKELFEELKRNNEYELLKKLFIYCVPPVENIGSNSQKYLEYLEYLSKLAEVNKKLEHATGVMESNYEIPDLTRNILEKINKVFDSEKEFVYKQFSN
jgi:hypothetical protein